MRGCVACGSVPALAPAGSDVAGFYLRARDERTGVEGLSLAGVEATGEVRVFDAICADGLLVPVGVVSWCHGEGEVRRAETFRVPLAVDRALGDPRLPLDAWGPRHLVANVDTEPAPDDAAPCARCALLGAGALAVGTRQELCGDSGRERHALAVVFERARPRVAAAAFVLRHVAPAVRLVDGARRSAPSRAR